MTESCIVQDRIPALPLPEPSMPDSAEALVGLDDYEDDD